MTSFIQSAESCETSPELMEAILQVARGCETAAEFIWENGPTDAQLCAIVEIVTNNGMYETTDFCWGASGYEWVDYYQSFRAKLDLTEEYIILRVPHRGNPTAQYMTAQELNRRHACAGDDKSFDQAPLEWMLDDLSFGAAYDSPDAVKDALIWLRDAGPRVGQCGPLVAAAVLEAEAVEMGWVEAPGLNIKGA